MTSVAQASSISSIKSLATLFARVTEMWWSYETSCNDSESAGRRLVEAIASCRSSTQRTSCANACTQLSPRCKVGSGSSTSGAPRSMTSFLPPYNEFTIADLLRTSSSCRPFS